MHENILKYTSIVKIKLIELIVLTVNDFTSRIGKNRDMLLLHLSVNRCLAKTFYDRADISITCRSYNDTYEDQSETNFAFRA